jgi:hypothetical protein
MPPCPLGSKQRLLPARGAHDRYFVWLSLEKSTACRCRLVRGGALRPLTHRYPLRVHHPNHRQSRCHQSASYRPPSAPGTLNAATRLDRGDKQPALFGCPNCPSSGQLLAASPCIPSSARSIARKVSVRVGILCREDSEWPERPPPSKIGQARTGHRVRGAKTSQNKPYPQRHFRTVGLCQPYSDITARPSRHSVALTAAGSPHSRSGPSS